MAPRLLLLFSRAPGREAREKGLAASAGEELFEAFAAGWAEAARVAGATLVVASAPADRPAWRRLFAAGSGLPAFVDQRGDSFGERLEDSARQASGLGVGGRLLVVGGDVAPSAADLARAFERLESGADAVIAPADDGGVSLVGLPIADLGLLGEMAPRRRDVFPRLRDRLQSRGRRVAVLPALPDVDGRTTRTHVADFETLRVHAGLLRRAFERPAEPEVIPRTLPSRPSASSAAFRGPPRPA